MKITCATIYYVNGEGLKPVIVKLETDSGDVGLGEAAPSYGAGGTGAAGMIKDLCARFVVGKDPRSINTIVAEMYDQSFWLRNPGESLVPRSALSNRRFGTSRRGRLTFRSTSFLAARCATARTAGISVRSPRPNCC